MWSHFSTYLVPEKMMSNPPDSVLEFAETTGLAFDDLSLLRTALTHRSYLNEHPEREGEDNERMEYLGDAVLDFILADYLYRAMPEATEGTLTALRAEMVRRETLARFAQQLELGQALLMGRGEEETGGRDRSGTQCAAFEALVGAIFLDQGIEPAREFVLPFVEEALPLALEEVLGKDPKSRLQELAQGSLGVTPRYRTVRSEGPDHAKTFTVEVAIGDVVCGEGQGPNKQIAAQRAAMEALAQAEHWPARSA
jgi:ribonuclease-3